MVGFLNCAPDKRLADSLSLYFECPHCGGGMVMDVVEYRRARQTNPLIVEFYVHGHCDRCCTYASRVVWHNGKCLCTHWCEDTIMGGPSPLCDH